MFRPADLACAITRQPTHLPWHPGTPKSNRPSPTTNRDDCTGRTHYARGHVPGGQTEAMMQDGWYDVDVSFHVFVPNASSA